MNLGALAFSSILAARPELAASLRYSGDRPELAGVVTRAMSTGIEQRTQQTDAGVLAGADGIVRYLTADEPPGWSYSATMGTAAIVGQRVEITLPRATRPIRCRVDGRREADGAVRLNLMAEYGEQ